MYICTQLNRISMRHYIVGILILALLSCSQKHDRQVSADAAAADSLYTEQAALLMYSADPDRALAVIDSAQMLGNVDAFNADLVRATVYGHSMDSPRREKGIELCLDMLQRDEAQPRTQKQADNRINVLNVITDACRSKKDIENWLKYSIEVADIHRSWGNTTDALRTEAEIGVVFTRIGRTEEGISMLDASVEALAELTPPSLDALDAWIVAAKRKMNVLDEQGKPEEIVPLAREIIDRLDYYDAHAAEFKEDSYRLPPNPEDRAHWREFYLAQGHIFLARAYALMGYRSDARAELRIFEASEYGNSLNCRKITAPALKLLGEWDKLADVDNELQRRMGTDTLNVDYASILQDRADVAYARGRYKDAFSWLERYAALQDKLERGLRESQAQDYAARYRQKEQEIALAAARAESRKRGNIILAILAFLVFAALVTAGVAYERRIIAQKNKALARMINEKQPRVSAAQAEDADSDNLFREIDSVIRNERLYANANLQRQDILDRWNLRRQTLNDLMTTYAGGESFPAYINAIRLDEAVRMMREDASMTIGSIAIAVGFTIANFRIQFKQRYGMTPAEYREAQDSVA